MDWSFKRKSAKSLHPVTIPQPPEKDANLGLSEPYKMTAKCRGIGKYNDHDICIALYFVYIKDATHVIYEQKLPLCEQKQLVRRQTTSNKVWEVQHCVAK